MFPTAVPLLSIKDLKDLSVFFAVRDTIDMQDLKDLKRFSRGSGDRGGQAPALRVRKGFSSPCAVRDREVSPTPRPSRLSESRWTKL